MAYLYLDTSNGLTIGLLDLDFNWKSYEYIDSKKPSEIIHQKINLLLESENLSIKEIKLILAAGPGSYTGMRLGEGIANIMKLCGVDIFSFYHFEVPALLDINNGVWITNAFKNQFFIYEWDQDKKSEILMNANDMNFDKEIYSNIEQSLFLKTINTSLLIHQHSQKIFAKVIKRSQFFPSFYFRSLDEEFKSIC